MPGGDSTRIYKTLAAVQLERMQFSTMHNVRYGASYYAGVEPHAQSKHHSKLQCHINTKAL